MSWWFKVSGPEPFDTIMNRIEKADSSAKRIGMQLVVGAGKFDEHFTLYHTPSLSGERITLFGEKDCFEVGRGELFWNGDYLWTEKSATRV
jgi:hypothetical protein